MDISAFHDFHLPALQADEARHNLIVAMLAQAKESQAPDLLTWTLGGPGCCAVKAPGRGVVLGDLNKDQCVGLAEDGRFLFWTVDGAPVSMAGIPRRTPNAAAIAPVYTPPDRRRRGYAGCITAAAVDRIHAEGRKTACLYTDLRNPISNRCFTKIGFRPVCDSWFFARRP